MVKIKADLHNHLGTLKKTQDKYFNKSIDIAVKRLGTGGMFAVVNFIDGKTGHLDDRYETFIGMKGYDRLYIGEKRNGIYVNDKDIFVVKGQEVPTKQGHLLVLGIGAGKHLKTWRSLEDTIKEAKDNNGIIIPDHGWYLGGIGNYICKNPKILENIDAIEIHNGEASFGLPFGPLPINANKKAQEFYLKAKKDNPHLGALSSSDGHSLYELGTSWIEIDEPEINPNFIPSLRNSIQNTNARTPMKTHNSYIGTMDHLASLIFIVGASKLGIKF